jgi:type I restriction enzyme S subunit
MVSNMREMKDSGVEWIGEIPNSWELMPMKAILIERKENNYPIITDNILSLTIEQGVIPIAEKNSAGGNKPKEDLTKYRLAYPDDIVINSMNILAGAVGISAYLGIVSPVYYTLYSSSDEFTSKYYHDLFQTKPFQDNLFGLGNGIMMKKSESSGKLNTIRMRIPMSKLGLLMLPVPSFCEQQKIATYLDQKVALIDNIIDKTKKSIEEYKKYKQSLITETVTKGLNPDVKMKDSRIEVDWRDT